MPPSPTSSVFPGSSSSRDTPNVHPYAIKTSSSAVLTRSNSTGHRLDTNHHYTPPSPTKNAINIKPSRYVPSHKHTKSLPSTNGITGVNPPPVPMPPSSSLPARLANQGYTNVSQAIVSDGESIPPTPPLTWRIKRSDTLPSIPTSRSDTETNIQDLPKNPKVWTPTQLSMYLSSALRLKGGAKLPVPVVRDIGLFVLQEHLSGRAFLRMKKEDYDFLGINQLWKDALLDANRVLRRNLVQGRIMGYGSGTPLSSLSAEGLQEEDVDLADLPAYSSLDPIRRRRSGSAPLQWDEDKKRMSKTSFRAGRVRGMVQTYERSCSESSASGSECDEHDNDPTNVDAQLVSELAEDEGGFASGEMTSVSEDEGDFSTVSATQVNHNTANDIDPFSKSGSDPSVLEPANMTQSSPSIEALLFEQEKDGAQSNPCRSWGAKAWEDELVDPTVVHATAKRIPIDAPKPSVYEPTTVNMNTPALSSVETGLVQLFSELTIQEPPVTKAPDDFSARVSGPTLSETLEACQKRLEAVERRLDEMERKDQEREMVLQQAQSEVEHHYHEESTPARHEETVVRSRFRLPCPFNVLYPDESDLGNEQKQVKNYSEVDPSVSGLPRYMFLISLGVVAITMRVVLRRVVGGRRRC